jgi:integrase
MDRGARTARCRPGNGQVELPLFWLSRQLGHSSTRVTEMVYGHWEKKARQEAAQKLEGVFGV